MAAKKMITVQIASKDLDVLREKELILFVGRTGPSHRTQPHVWRQFGDLRPNHSIPWNIDYALSAASAADGGETPDGPVALWFGPPAEVGSAAPFGAAIVLADLSATDTVVVSYADGRWNPIEAK